MRHFVFEWLLPTIFDVDLDNTYDAIELDKSEFRVQNDLWLSSTTTI